MIYGLSLRRFKVPDVPALYIVVVSVSAMPPCPLLFIIIPLPPNQNQ